MAALAERGCARGIFKDMELESFATSRSVREPSSPSDLFAKLRVAMAALERSWDTTFRHSPVARTLVVNEGGIFLGATRLAPGVRGYERHIHALVSFAAGKIAPASLVKTIEAAEADYSAGDKAMLAVRLALAIPTPETDEENCRKFHIAAGLMDEGFLSPRELLVLTNIGGSECEQLDKYSLDQPRVPAGNSDGGQWTSGDSDSPAPGRDKHPRPSENQVGVLMPAGCESEWNSAIEYCEELLAMPHPPRGLTGGHTDAMGCAKGFVSERCGGNKF